MRLTKITVGITTTKKKSNFIEIKVIWLFSKWMLMFYEKKNMFWTKAKKYLYSDKNLKHQNIYHKRWISNHKLINKYL